MIKIIKKGTKKPTITFDCPTCGCVFESNEFLYIHRTPQLQETFNVKSGYLEKCPQCMEDCISHD